MAMKSLPDEIFVGVDSDLNLWAAKTLGGLQLELERSCGGYLDKPKITHHVEIEGSNSKEAIGWEFEWIDSADTKFTIYVEKMRIRDDSV